MFLKLFKHDIINSYKDYIYLYIGILAYSLIIPFLIRSSATHWFSGMVIGLSTMALFFGGFFVMIRNVFSFINRRLYSDAGYFTFSLPVPTWQIILSKVITLTLWMLVTSLVVMAGMYFFLFGILGTLENWMTIFPIDELKAQIDLILKNINWFHFSINFVEGIISYAGAMSLIILVMGVVRSSLVKTRKYVLSVVLFFGLGWLWSLIKVLVISLLFNLDPVEMVVKEHNTIPAFLKIAQSLPYIGINLLVTIIFAGLAFYGANWVLEKKLQI